MAKHPWEFAYEAKCEEIEGAANYVEWQVLRQLDGERAAALTERMRQTMTGPEFLFPIRISCYFTGALTIHALRSAGLYSFRPAQRPAILPILAETAPSDGIFPGKSDLDRAVSEATAAFEAESEAIVRTALERNEIVLTGPLELGFVNIYDARRWRDYLTSTYFLTFRDGETERMIPGNFVIRMRDQKTIDTVYRWK